MSNLVAGITHDLILRYGLPGAYKYAGLMLPSAMSRANEPYNPFAPQTRQGNATNQDFSITSVWEMFSDLSAGTGHKRAGNIEANGFSFSQGNGVGTNIGPCLYTGYKGRLLPAPLAMEVGYDGTDTAVGPVLPGAIVTSANVSNPTNALTSDGTYASPTLAFSSNIRFGTFTFGIVGAPIISGIKVEVICKNGYPYTGAPGTLPGSAHATVTILNGAAWCQPTATAFAQPVPRDSATPVTLTFGGEGDLWGAPWTLANLNNLQVIVGLGSNPTATGAVYVDYIRVTVYTGISTINVRMTTFQGKVYAASQSKIYRLSGSGWDEVDTANGAVKQLYSAGNKLYATSGTAQFTRSTTDGTTWGNEAFKADFVATTQDGVLSYAAAATLNPGGTHPSKIIGSDSTYILGLQWLDDFLWIAKPEGLFQWESSTDKVRLKFDAGELNSADNFVVFTIHRRLLYFNIRNMLYFASNNDRYTEIFPDQTNGFDKFHCALATGGPILFGVRMQDREYLMMFRGPDEPGLHPLWSDADGTHPITAMSATTNENYNQLMFTCLGVGMYFMPMTSRYDPYSFMPATRVTAPYIELTPHDGGFPILPKWFYQVITNTVDPGDITGVSACIMYSTDGGKTWATVTDDTGIAKTFSLENDVDGGYFPLDTVGHDIRLRIYLWPTSTLAQTENTPDPITGISTLTVRGCVITTRRDIISFTVVATQTVKGKAANVYDRGSEIKAALTEASKQKYPCAIQSPDGSWHLVLFRPPTPREAVIEEINSTTHSTETFTVIQVAFAEIDALTTTGTFKAWEAG